MKYLPLALIFFLSGCGVSQYPAHKVTTSNQVYHTCVYKVGFGSIGFYDESGNWITLGGDWKLEEDFEYVCEEGNPPIARPR